MRFLFTPIFALLAFAGGTFAASPHFGVHVVDASTGRGVPLVELETVHHVSFFTDSHGYAAVDDPDLLGHPVFFHVRSHGYSITPDGLGSYGRVLEVKPGGIAKLKLNRSNIAERLYRITGQGIYRDSRMLGLPAPREHNGKVAGQDSTWAARYAGKIYWFGGDTMQLRYPLGHFRTCGATTPDRINPDEFIPLDYLTKPDGFSRGMWPFAAGEAPHLLMWTDGLVVAADDAGRERLISHYEQHQSLDQVTEHGLGVFNDATQEFDRWSKFALSNAWQHPRGHAVRGRGELDGYVLFRANHDHHAPFPAVRVRATLAALSDPGSYEAFTCRRADGSIAKDASDRAVWSWRHDAAPISQDEEAALIRDGKLRAEDARYQVRDPDSGKPVTFAGGSVRWNDFRKKWVMIAAQRGGSSFLGEICFSEADDVTGPWRWARKIVTHDRQTFYNPVHHDFLDREGGRFIYFEGTYSNEFSGNPAATPRYQYNQIMYRLDLSDSRLAPPQP